MTENKTKVYKTISIIFLMIIIVLAVSIYILTYLHQNSTSKNSIIFWTIKNHLSISIILIILSVVIGYISSSLVYKQLTTTKKDSEKLLEMLLLFLNKEEKEIINCLVKNKGTVNQADISRLPEMNRVKAFRSLQKMQEKKLIDIIAHGKIRKISLKENILKMLVKE